MLALILANPRAVMVGVLVALCIGAGIWVYQSGKRAAEIHHAEQEAAAAHQATEARRNAERDAATAPDIRGGLREGGWLRD